MAELRNTRNILKHENIEYFETRNIRNILKRDDNIRNSLKRGMRGKYFKKGYKKYTFCP